MAALLSSFHPLLPIISSTTTNIMSTRPRAVLDTAYKMKVPYELKQGQSRIFHQLPSGSKMEVIFQKGVGGNTEGKMAVSQNPPLVFVHGSFHAAWCWAEHWLPFFSKSGYDCYALSLLGQGESDAPAGAVAGMLQVGLGYIPGH